MDFVIQDASAEQIAAVEEIEKQCFSSPWTADQLKTQLDGERHVFLTAIKDRQVLGYVGMMFVLDEGYISNVAVSPACRRIGIADALVHTIIKRAEALELAFVTLEVRAGNEPAKALYSKHGFVPVGLRKNYYDKPTEDAVLMTKYLK